MTDNTKPNPEQNSEQKLNQNPAQNPEQNLEQNRDTQADSSDSSTKSTKLAAQKNNSADKPSEPQMKMVDIVIAGVTYQIYCPIDEEEELRAAVYYINNFLLDIKKGAPGLSQEHLLVLCCLNLYEKIHANNKTNDANKQQSKQTEALLSKILKDAQSIL